MAGRALLLTAVTSLGVISMIIVKPLSQMPNPKILNFAGHYQFSQQRKQYFCKKVFIFKDANNCKIILDQWAGEKFKYQSKSWLDHFDCKSRHHSCPCPSPPSVPRSRGRPVSWPGIAPCLSRRRGGNQLRCRTPPPPSAACSKTSPS